MRMGSVKKWMPAVAAVTGVFLLSSVPAFACPFCYSSAAAGAKGVRALQSGILILLIPAVTIFFGLLWATFRYRNSYPSWPDQGRAEELGSLADSASVEWERELRDSLDAPFLPPASGPVYEEGAAPSRF